jgi:hypothetical protein
MIEQEWAHGARRVPVDVSRTLLAPPGSLRFNAPCRARPRLNAGTSYASHRRMGMCFLKVLQLSTRRTLAPTHRREIRRNHISPCLEDAGLTCSGSRSAGWRARIVAPALARLRLNTRIVIGGSMSAATEEQPREVPIDYGGGSTLKAAEALRSGRSVVAPVVDLGVPGRVARDGAAA